MRSPAAAYNISYPARTRQSLKKLAVVGVVTKGYLVRMNGGLRSVGQSWWRNGPSWQAVPLRTLHKANQRKLEIFRDFLPVHSKFNAWRLVGDDTNKGEGCSTFVPLFVPLCSAFCGTEQ